MPTLNSFDDDSIDALRRDHEYLSKEVRNLKLRLEGMRHGGEPAGGLIGYAEEKIDKRVGVFPGNGAAKIFKIHPATGGLIQHGVADQLVFNLDDELVVKAGSFFPVHREWPSSRLVCHGLDIDEDEDLTGGGCISFTALTGVERVGNKLVFSRVQVEPKPRGCFLVTDLAGLEVGICGCEDCFEKLRFRNLCLNVTGSTCTGMPDQKVAFEYYDGQDWDDLHTNDPTYTGDFVGGWYGTYSAAGCTFNISLTYDESADEWLFWLACYANRSVIDVECSDPFELLLDIGDCGTESSVGGGGGSSSSEVSCSTVPIMDITLSGVSGTGDLEDIPPWDTGIYTAVSPIADHVWYAGATGPDPLLGHEIRIQCDDDGVIIPTGSYDDGAGSDSYAANHQITATTANSMTVLYQWSDGGVEQATVTATWSW